MRMTARVEDGDDYDLVGFETVNDAVGKSMHDGAAVGAIQGRIAERMAIDTTQGLVDAQ